MSLAAETIDQSQVYPYLVGDVPEVIAVAELPEDEEAVRRAEALMRYAGGVVVEQSATTDERLRINSLSEAIELASEGNETALNFLRADVESDLLERTIKSGIVLEVELEVDDQYELWQHGQTVTRIQYNTLKHASNHPAMRRRAEAEARNSFRLKSQYMQGRLEDASFLVISRTSTKMSDQELAKAGFFIDDKPFVLQLATATPDGIKLESAFMSSKPDIDSPRQDEEVINTLGELLGIDLSSLDDDELLDFPLLIDNSLIPDGVVSLVEMCDRGRWTFYGKRQAREDYVEHRQKGRERIKDYAAKTQLVMGQLIASKSKIKKPEDAVKLLDEYADQAMVAYAIQDKRIDPRVFGAPAAPIIEEARILQELGLTEEAEAKVKQAQELSESGSCPNGIEHDTEQEWHGGKKHLNKMCHSCKKVKVEVGTCFICKSCVLNPPKLKLAA